jgi:hypothetical protein
VAIELVAPAPIAGSSSPVTSFLSRDGGLHHLCYEVRNLEQQIAEMRARNCLLERRKNRLSRSAAEESRGL